VPDRKQEGTASPATLRPGTPFLDEYEVERALGEGGLGRVWLVRNRSSGQQYAVKRGLYPDPGNREKFLADLQTWINLPEHTHVVPCRFFREVGAEVFIFSDFVSGGSLADWIRGRKLTSLEQILDVAIQMAWGLHAAHETGAIHQDVKPANVLMTTDGIARIADFGLARARLRGGERAGKESRNQLVSTGGRTPAYCSPEQAEEERLTRQTDVWSWGLSVLEMFTGEVNWTSGPVALDALKHYQASGGRPGLPTIPEPLVPILRRCFKWQPNDRWETLGATASAVAAVHARVLGKPYNREAPIRKGAGPRKGTTASQAPTRSWPNPRPWLDEALLADGKVAEEPDKLLPPGQPTRREQAAADLGTYEKARMVFLRLVKSGRDELLPTLACLHLDNATLLESSGDQATAARLYEEVIKIFHHLVDRKGHADLTGELGLAHERKADLLQRQRRSKEALDISEQAMAIWEGLIQRDACMAFHARLAAACARKAELLRTLGASAEVSGLCHRAVAGLRPLSKQPAAIHLAAARVTEAHTCHALGDYRGAVQAADKALAVCRDLTQRVGKIRELRQQAAELLEAAAVVEGQRQNLPPRARIRNFDQAIGLLEQTVHAEGHAELAGDLARAQRSKELDMAAQDQRPPTAALPEMCSTLWQLLRQEGREGLARRLIGAYEAPAHALAKKEPAAQLDRYVFHYERLVPGVQESEVQARQAEALLVKSVAVSGCGDDRGALVVAEQALALWARLVSLEGRSEHAERQAATDAELARLLAGAGNQEKARSHYAQAIAVYRQLIERDGRKDLEVDLASLQESRALLGDSAT
jgi:serine/threonine protein kinase